MRWAYDPNKDTINRRQHGLPLSIGELALSDPLVLSRPDLHPDGDRWNSLGEVESVLLFVVHTWPDGDDRTGRIISVRKATRHERRAYEDGEH